VFVGLFVRSFVGVVVSVFTGRRAAGESAVNSDVAGERRCARLAEVELVLISRAVGLHQTYVRGAVCRERAACSCNEGQCRLSSSWVVKVTC